MKYKSMISLAKISVFGLGGYKASLLEEMDE